jgi:hypothetical protein
LKPAVFLRSAAFSLALTVLVPFAAAAQTKTALACLNAKAAPEHDPIHGCWRGDFFRSQRESGVPAQQPDVTVLLCFVKDGTISGHYFEKTGEAGDISLGWLRQGNDHILIDGAPCTISFGAHARDLTLSDCRYTGRWTLECEDPIQSSQCLN